MMMMKKTTPEGNTGQYDSPLTSRKFVANPQIPGCQSRTSPKAVNIPKSTA
jgi:hypothetical protein